PKSPVNSQPSFNTSFVSFSLFQYPFMTWGPLTAISPTSPCSSSSKVPTFTIFASVSGHGTPILPFTLFDHKKFACVTGEVSVKPYPSTKRTRVSFSNCCCTSTGSGADPLIHALIDDRSYFLRSG